MSVSAVLFDLDGTLLDTAPDFETAVNGVLEDKKLAPLHVDAIREHIGDGSAGIIASVFGLGKDHPNFPALQQQLLQNYRACSTEKTQIFPNLDTSIEWLDKHEIPWGIVTNKPSEYADPVVQLLLPSCQVLVCPDHVTRPKPDPEGIVQACKKLDIAPAECLYVGDHIRDIKAGQAAHTKTLAVGWGYIGADDKPDTWDADWCINTTPEMLPLLKTLFNKNSL